MWGAVIGGGFSMVAGIMGQKAAKKREQKAAQERLVLQSKLNNLEANRQDIVNPFQDMSAMISNPFANLSVATKAAEMKIEEADISLASTLDTLRATGASAGGATALAQAALRSKKGVTAQDALMREGQRVQQGEAWEFGQREQREMQQLDRTASLLGASKQAEAQAQMDGTQAMTGMLGTLGGIAGSAFGSTSS